MKKLATLVLFVVFSFVVVLNSSAQNNLQQQKNKELAVKNTENNRIDIRVNSSNKVIFRVDFLADQKRLDYALKISSESDKNVYNKQFFAKKPIYMSFDLSNLPKEKYTFIVTKKGVPLYSKTIVYKPSQVTYKPEELIVEEL